MRRHHHRRSPRQRAVAEANSGAPHPARIRSSRSSSQSPDSSTSRQGSFIHSSLKSLASSSRLGMRAASCRCASDGAPPSAAKTTSTPCAPERLGQLHRVGPNAADGVARHEDALDHRFELHQWRRTLFLNVAELVEAAQVEIVRALPGAIVGRAPAPRVVGRAGIGEQRHGLVGPDAVLVQMRAPRLARRPDRRRCESSRLACTNGTRFFAWISRSR